MDVDFFILIRKLRHHFIMAQFTDANPLQEFKSFAKTLRKASSKAQTKQQVKQIFILNNSMFVLLIAVSKALHEIDMIDPMVIKIHADLAEYLHNAMLQLKVIFDKKTA
jgi:hypothetical protein